MQVDLLNLGTGAGKNMPSEKAELLSLDDLFAAFELELLSVEQMPETAMNSTVPVASFAILDGFPIAEIPQTTEVTDQVATVPDPLPDPEMLAEHMVQVGVNFAPPETFGHESSFDSKVKRDDYMPELGQRVQIETPDMAPPTIDINAVDIKQHDPVEPSKAELNLPFAGIRPIPAASKNQTEGATSEAAPTSERKVPHEVGIIARNSVVDLSSEDLSKPPIQSSERQASTESLELSAVPKAKMDGAIGTVSDPFEALVFSKGNSITSDGILRATSSPISAPHSATSVQITEQVVAAVSSVNDETIEIRLDPPELGKVRVTLTHSDAGTLAQVVSEKPDVSDLLRRNAALLTKELIKAGFENVSLDFQNSGHQNSSSQTSDSEIMKHEIDNDQISSTPKTRSVSVTLSDTLDRRI